MSITARSTIKFKHIDFLVRRKFPHCLIDPSTGDILGASTIITAALILEIKSYINMLMSMTDENFERLVSIEKEKETKELDEFEKTFFFNDPNLPIDFNYWANMSSWSLEEMVALSFGRPPHIVTINTIMRERGYHESRFYKAYHNRVILAERALADHNKLYERLPPLEWVEWLKKNKINFPATLEKAVYERWGKLDDLDGKYQALIIENEKLLNLCNELKKQQINEENEEKLNPKIKNSLHKLVLVMAIEKYRHDPKAEKNTSTTNIRSAVEQYGLDIDDNTIRARLDEAYNGLKSKIIL